MICARCLMRLSTSTTRRGLVQTVKTSLTAPKSASAKALTVTSILQQSRCLSQSTRRTSSASASLLAPAQFTAASAAQPFTVPAGMSPADGADGKATIETTRVLSSVPAGTPLRGLDIYKGREAPVAMEDSAYPNWLWTVLDEGRPAGADDGVIGNLSKKAAKKAARKAAKKAAKMGQVEQDEVVPINEQTIDLPVGDMKEAMAARQQLTKAMRAKRRASIKESNFLKTM